MRIDEFRRSPLRLARLTPDPDPEPDPALDLELNSELESDVELELELELELEELSNEIGGSCRGDIDGERVEDDAWGRVMEREGGSEGEELSSEKGVGEAKEEDEEEAPKRSGVKGAGPARRQSVGVCGVARAMVEGDSSNEASESCWLRDGRRWELGCRRGDMSTISRSRSLSVLS